jgi:hypothetical protein
MTQKSSLEGSTTGFPIHALPSQHRKRFGHFAPFRFNEIEQLFRRARILVIFRVRVRRFDVINFCLNFLAGYHPPHSIATFDEGQVRIYFIYAIFLWERMTRRYAEPFSSAQSVFCSVV